MALGSQQDKTDCSLVPSCSVGAAHHLLVHPEDSLRWGGGPLRQPCGNQTARKGTGVSGYSPANPRHFWLPDLGSNQGPTD